MAERKTFLLRIDGNVLDALRKWADDDLRSLNGQIEFILRKSLRDQRRLKDSAGSTETPEPPSNQDPTPPSPRSSSTTDESEVV
jgi:hypothetical protein